ncbi:recombinase family protein, partial [Xanthobacter autotrophicus]
EINRALRRMHPEIVAEIISGVASTGGTAVQDGGGELLTINGEFTVSVVLARCHQIPAGALRWRIRLDTGLAPDITIAIRMGEANEVPLDYYLLPSIDMTLPHLRLGR